MPLYSYYLVEMLAHVALNSSQHPVSIMVTNIKYIIYCSGQVKQFGWWVIPNWIQGGTLSLIIDYHAMVWSLRLAMDTCCLAIGSSRHPVPTSPLPQLGRLGAYYNHWHGSSHPVSNLSLSCQKILVSFLILIGYKDTHNLWPCHELTLHSVMDTRHPAMG
jgi:hypothetical protein